MESRDSGVILKCVVLDGGPPWGMRITGGCDTNVHLRVSRVNPGSKAATAGARDGDLVVAINEAPASQLTNGEAHKLMKQSGRKISLKLQTPRRVSLSEAHSREGKIRSNSSPPVSVLNDTVVASDLGKTQVIETEVEENEGDKSAQAIQTEDTEVIPAEAEVTKESLDREEPPPIPEKKSKQKSLSSPTLVKNSSPKKTDKKKTSGKEDKKKVQSKGLRSHAESGKEESDTKKTETGGKLSSIQGWLPSTTSPLTKKKYKPVTFPVPDSKISTSSQEGILKSPVQPDATVIDTSSGERVTSPSSVSVNLPKYPNSTVTLLQKRREGQLPKGASYLEEGDSKSKSLREQVPRSHSSDGLRARNLSFTSESQYRLDDDVEVMVNPLPSKKFKSSLTRSKSFVPQGLYETGAQNNQTLKHEWYKRMYETLHVDPAVKRDNVTIKYKPRGNVKPVLRSRSTTRGTFSDAGGYESDSCAIRFRPGRIENYTPGHSAVVETKVPTTPTRPGHYSGYESDTDLIIRKREQDIADCGATSPSPLGPAEQRQAYLEIQKGGEVPLCGLRKPAPERPKDCEERFRLDRETPGSKMLSSEGKRLSKASCPNTQSSRTSGSVRSASQQTKIMTKSKKEVKVEDSGSEMSGRQQASELHKPRIVDKMRKKNSGGIGKIPVIEKLKKSSSQLISPAEVKKVMKATSNKISVELKVDDPSKGTNTIETLTVSRNSTDGPVELRKTVKKVWSEPEIKDSTQINGKVTQNEKKSSTKSRKNVKISDHVTVRNGGTSHQKLNANGNDVPPKPPRKFLTPSISQRTNAGCMRDASETVGQADEKDSEGKRKAKLHGKKNPESSKLPLAHKGVTSMSKLAARHAACLSPSSTPPRSFSPSSACSTPRKAASLEKLHGSEMTSGRKKTDVKGDTTKPIIVGAVRHGEIDIMKSKPDNLQTSSEHSHFFPPDPLKEHVQEESKRSATEKIETITTPEPTGSQLKPQFRPKAQSTIKPIIHSKLTYMTIPLRKNHKNKMKSYLQLVSIGPQIQSCHSLPALTPYLNEAKKVTKSAFVLSSVLKNPPPVAPLVKHTKTSFLREQMSNFPNVSSQELVRSVSCLGLRDKLIKDHNYSNYILEVQHSRQRSPRFLQLHRLYSSLERLGELQRSISLYNIPLLSSKRQADFEAWWKVRNRLKMEDEMSAIAGQLISAQKNREFLYLCKDLEKLKWKGDTSLRCKLKNINELRSKLLSSLHEWDEYCFSESMNASKRRFTQSAQDLHKAYWRGSSVKEIALNLEVSALAHKNDDYYFSNSMMMSEFMKTPGLRRAFSMSSTLSDEQRKSIKCRLGTMLSNKRKEDGKMIDKISSKKHDQVKLVKTSPMGAGPPGGNSTGGNLNVDGSISESVKRKLSKSISDEVKKKKEKDDDIFLSYKFPSITRRIIERKQNENALKRKAPFFSVYRKDRVNSKVSYFENCQDALKEVNNGEDVYQSLPPEVQVRGESPGCAEGSYSAKKPRARSASPEAKFFRNDNNSKLTRGGTAWVPSALTMSKNSKSYISHLNIISKLASMILRKDENLSKLVKKEIMERDRLDRLHLSNLGEVDRLKHYFESQALGEEEALNRSEIELLRCLFCSDPNLMYLTEEKLNRRELSPFALHGRRRCASAEGFKTSFKSQAASAQFQKRLKPDGKESSPVHATSPDLYLSSRSRKPIYEPSSTPNVCQPTMTAHCYLESPIAELESYYGSDTRSWGCSSPALSSMRAYSPMESVNMSVTNLSTVRTGPHSSPRPSDSQNGAKKWTNVDPTAHQPRYRYVPVPPVLPRNFESRVPFKTRSLRNLDCSSQDGTKYPYLYRSVRYWERPPSSRSTSSFPRENETYWSEAGSLEGECRVLGRSNYIEKDEIKVGKFSEEEEEGNIENKFLSNESSDVRSDGKEWKSFPVIRSFSMNAYDEALRKREEVEKYLGYSSMEKRRGDAADVDNNKIVVSKSIEGNKRTGRSYGDSMTLSRTSIENFPEESPCVKYAESEVNIHYKAPVRIEEKVYIHEDELRRKEKARMVQYYEDLNERKYLQGIQDIENRRHSDNFTPMQKSPISLNRYDMMDDESVPTSPKRASKTPERKVHARALYQFVAQNPRELNLRKGDLVLIRRRLDRNWYEGELNSAVGIFPSSYVEKISSPEKIVCEGFAKALYDFSAATSMELPMKKGDKVAIIRRVDENWYEGRIGSRKGIFPVKYVQILKSSRLRQSSSQPKSLSQRMKQPIGTQSYVPNGFGQQRHASQDYRYNGVSIDDSYNPVREQYTDYDRRDRSRGYGGSSQAGTGALDLNDASVVFTNQYDARYAPVRFYALYNYKPQHEDELELMEGDEVHVLEKCDDGWFVGTSLRTGHFGTFPGNYVEKFYKQ